ncbi:hypothetical protein BDR26DRAFT_833978 [Obelidium mucronatum]|nr:hypothetical protein BDR26DRAFT_833978 [Obelidium mucronatum]
MILSSRHFAEQNLNHHSSKANSIDSERTSATEFDHLYFHCPEKYQDVYARHHLSHLALIYWSDESFQNSPKLPPSLGTLQQLCFLHLSGSNISGEVPEALFELASLEELDLGGNMLNGGLSQNIGKMQSLVCLSLDGNLLSGSIPDEVGSLSHLKQLDLSENAFSGKIPSSFGNLKNLIYLFLNNNQIEGGVPAEMFGLAQLRHFMANDNRLQFVIGYEAVRGFANLDVWDMSNNISVTSDLFQRGNYRGGWFF